MFRNLQVPWLWIISFQTSVNYVELYYVSGCRNNYICLSRHILDLFVNLWDIDMSIANKNTMVTQGLLQTTTTTTKFLSPKM